MTRRAARFLTRLYPAAWRARYAEEFQTFLESRRVPPFEILNILASAFSGRFLEATLMTNLQRSLIIMAYACLATIAAGGALYLAVDDTSLVSAIQTHPALWVCWSLIEASSLGMLAAGAAIAVPVLFRILRERRRDPLRRLALPVGVAAALFLWFAGVAAWTGWPPLPWTIFNRPGGPALQLRWILAMVTLVLLGCLFESAAVALKFVIVHNEFSQSVARIKLAILTLAASIVVMTVMAAGWGLLANHYTRDAFVGAGTYLYWSVVLSVLGAASVSAIHSMRKLFSGRME
jgi:hypothetical protein